SVRLRLYVALMNECPVKDNLKYGQATVDLIDKLLSQTNDAKSKRRLLKSKAYAFDIIALYFSAAKQDPDKWFDYQKKCLAIYKQINDSTMLYIQYIKLSSHLRDKGDLPGALDLLQKGLAKCEELKDKRGIIACLSELGDMYSDQGDTSQAKDLYNRMLSLAHELNDKDFLAQTMMKVGGLYNAMGNYNTALAYYDKGMVLFTETNDIGGKMEIYKNSGYTYNKKGNYDASILCFKNAIQIAEEKKKPIAVVDFMAQMAAVYANKKDYKSAVEIIDKAIAYNEKHREYGGMKGLLQSKLAGIYWQQKNFKKAKYYNDLSLWTMKNNGITVMRDLEERAAKIDSACGEYKTAYFHYQNYILLKEKSMSEEVSKAAAKEKFQADYKKQKELDKAEQDKKDLIAKEELQKQKIVRNSFIGGFTLLLILAGVVFRNYRQKQKSNILLEEKNALIEEKHKEITDSINYAERIQRSFMATQQHLNANLKEYFVLFKPKDVVSGDFYWSATLNNGNFILATADSTGHGVPGAIMSLLNITSLEKAIETKTSPDEVLIAARKTIIERLKKDGSEYGGKDGMDCSLISFDPKNKKLFIANANNPVWIVRPASLSPGKEEEVTEIRADKMPVGKHDRDQEPFTLKTIDVKEGDVIYAVTDGFPDQFGGEKGKKFMSKNLRELLAKNASLPMSEQKLLLEKTFKDWIGTLEQVDDVTVIGIRI
ncbi:MAG: tetratricopeptide repeat protein, partial [Bacteroidia bacterium]